MVRVMMVRVLMMMVVRMIMRMHMRMAGILTEQERFDGHRHRHRRHADTAKIDVIEVPQG